MPRDTDKTIGQEPDLVAPELRLLAMLSICLAIGMAVLDGVIANVALPTIATTLHATPAASIWVINAFQLAVTIALLPAASLGDSIGYRRVFLFSLAGFTLASFACSLSTSLPMLVAARVAQGLGGAGMMSVSTALVRFLYPRSQLGRGIGYVTLTVALSAASGPTIAAGLLAIAPWPFLFAINLPIGVVTLALGWRAIPRTHGNGHRFDLLSAGLNALAFGLLIALVNALGEEALSRPLLILLAIVLAVIWVIFVSQQLRRQAPMLPVDLMRAPIFALSVATSVCSYAASSLAYVALPFLFQLAGGHSQLATGLLITPWPAIVIFVAPLAGRLSDRYPAGLLGGLGLAIMAAGLFLLFLIPLDASYLDVAWRMALSGFGFGFFQSPNNRVMAAGSPPHRAGAASGMVSTARLLGQSLGAALVAFCFAVGADIEAGSRLALALACGFALCGMALSFSRLGTKGQALAR